MHLTRLYWIFQLFGWTLYVASALILTILSGTSIEKDAVITLCTVWVLGIGFTHALREVINQFQLAQQRLWRLIPLMISIAALQGTLLYFISQGVLALFGEHYGAPLYVQIRQILALILVMILWMLIYFMVQFLYRYRYEEMKKLTVEKERQQMELDALKSQLNPHFLFNAMNSIKALIREDPAQSMVSIDRLSRLLRTSIHTNDGKLIGFEQEWELVKDYLALEKMRYEDRLILTSDIHPDAFAFNIPPMMLQTLCENAIKHGIGQSKQGGRLHITAQKQDNKLWINIINTGQYLPSKQKGVGLTNSKRRLEVLFGTDYAFDITNTNNGEVAVTLGIPLISLDT